MDRMDSEDGSLAGEHGRRLAILEGLLFAAGTEGLSDRQIARALRIPPEAVASLCASLRWTQEEQGRMTRVERVAETWQLLTVPELSPYLSEAAAHPPAPSGLSQAALETVAIIAYRQPISRARIEEIRGVQSERAIGTLVARGLIEETGRSEGPGRPYLYGTTKEFLEYFGLESLSALPSLEDETHKDMKTGKTTSE